MSAYPVSSWTDQQKLKAVLTASKNYLPTEVGRQIDALVSPANLGIMAATLSVWAGAHFLGVGEIVDVGLLLVGALMIGWSIEDVGRELYEFGMITMRAKNQTDIDSAARHFASAVVTAGVTAVMAILLKRSAGKLQVARGATVGEVARARTPGLANVEVDAQAGELWRKPTVTGDANMSAGGGQTWWFGDVEYSTKGSATEQQLARVHELVHSFLRPRLKYLRRFRARLNASAYTRSVLIKYLEESLAETVAQVSARGVVGLLTGLRFPVANGYMTLQQLMCEGAEIGKIMMGTQRFSVQFVPGPPASADDSAWR